MRCAKCNSENPEDAKFCVECASELTNRCASCGAENPPRAKFCKQCAAPVAETAPTAPSGPRKADHRLKPAPLSERAEIPEGERKTITALFADIKGSMELI